MRMQDIMSTKVKVIKPTATADSALERMNQNNVHHLIVVRNGDVLGVISQRDLGGARGAALRRGQNVEDLMTRQVIAAKPTDTLRQVVNKLRGYGIGCVPVMLDGKLKGIVTIGDVLELIGRGVERPEQRTQRSTRKRARGGHLPFRRV